MQTLLKLASLAATCSAASHTATIADEPTLIDPATGTPLVEVGLLGGWDLLKNGDKYDLLTTLQHEVKFDKAWTFEANAQYNVWTCYSGMDLCFIVDATYSGTGWSYNVAQYQLSDLRRYDFTAGGPAPIDMESKGKEEYTAKFDEAGRASDVTGSESHKVFDELMSEASTAEHQVFLSRSEHYIRFWGSYDRFLNGYDLDTQTFIWFKDSVWELFDTKTNILDLGEATPAERKLVSSISDANVEYNSSPDVYTFCDPSSSGSNQCQGTICTQDSECQVQNCDSVQQVCLAEDDALEQQIPSIILEIIEELFVSDLSIRLSISTALLSALSISAIVF